ncbi:LysM peptidoglycan-binding domain-containing protein [Lysobacter sp. HA18]
MSTTGNDKSSNPISRAFSRIFHHDDEHAAASQPGATPHPTQNTQQVTPRVAAAPAPTVQQHAATQPRANTQTMAPPTPHPTPSATVSPTPTATQRTYTVQQGDSLSKIAKHIYGDANRWQLIYNANREHVSDPDRIYPGQVLMLPDAPSVH